MPVEFMVGSVQRIKRMVLVVGTILHVLFIGSREPLKPEVQCKVVI